MLSILNRISFIIIVNWIWAWVFGSF